MAKRKGNTDNLLTVAISEHQAYLLLDILDGLTSFREMPAQEQKYIKVFCKDLRDTFSITWL